MLLTQIYFRMNCMLQFIIKNLLLSEKCTYRKYSKNWDTTMITVNVVKVEPYGFTLPECIQKGGVGIAKSVDPEQTAP